MYYYDTKTEIGKATYDGEDAYTFGRCHLTRYGLSVSRFEHERKSENGPHFSIQAVNTTLLKEMIFSHLCYDFPLPFKFEFSGPVLGYVRACTGYSAAASGGDQRPITQLTFIGDLKQEGLSICISGTDGFIIEQDCGSRSEQFLTKQFSLLLLIEHSYIPPIIDIRTAGNIYENRFLGANETTKIYPTVTEP